MTAFTKDQINQQLFQWKPDGSGFRSESICIYDEFGETAFFRFFIEEYDPGGRAWIAKHVAKTFGLLPKPFRIIALCANARKAVEVGKEEYRADCAYELGTDYVSTVYAMEFCEYIVASYLKHQTFAALPHVVRLKTSTWRPGLIPDVRDPKTT